MEFIQMQSTIQTCLNKQFLLVASGYSAYRMHMNVNERIVSMNWTHDMRGSMHSQRENSAHEHFCGTFCTIFPI